MKQERMVFAFLVALGFIALPVCYADEFKYQVGQVWTYENRGGFTPAERNATSTYTVSVLRKEKVGDKECWVLKEEYDRWKQSTREAYIAPDFSRVQEVLRVEGNDQAAIFDPPFEEPVFTLEVGEQQRKEHVVTRRIVSRGLELTKQTITRTIMRFPDESVTVPAGTFESCIRVSEFQQSDVEMSGQKGKVVGSREYWWHPDTGMVKEMRRNRVLNADGKLLQEWQMEAVLKSIDSPDEEKKPKQ